MLRQRPPASTGRRIISSQEFNAVANRAGRMPETDVAFNNGQGGEEEEIDVTNWEVMRGTPRPGSAWYRAGDLEDFESEQLTKAALRETCNEFMGDNNCYVFDGSNGRSAVLIPGSSDNVPDIDNATSLTTRDFPMVMVPRKHIPGATKHHLVYFAIEDDDIPTYEGSLRRAANLLSQNVYDLKDIRVDPASVRATYYNPKTQRLHVGGVEGFLWDTPRGVLRTKLVEEEQQGDTSRSTRKRNRCALMHGGAAAASCVIPMRTYVHRKYVDCEGTCDHWTVLPFESLALRSLELEEKLNRDSSLSS